MSETIRTVIQGAFAQLQAQVLTVLPNVLAALLILLGGVLIGLVIGRVANWLLSARHLDRTAARLGLATSLEAIGIPSIVRALGLLVQWSVILLASIAAVSVLDARLAGELTRRFVLYLPDLVVGAVILGAGTLAAKYLSRAALIAAVNSEIRAARLLSALTRVAVMMVAVAVAFEHLGIGRSTMLVAFGVVFGGMALAVSIAVGLGTQDLVRRWLAERFDAREEKDQEPMLHHHW